MVLSTSRFRDMYSELSRFSSDMGCDTGFCQVGPTKACNCFYSFKGSRYMRGLPWAKCVPGKSDTRRGLPWAKCVPGESDTRR